MTTSEWNVLHCAMHQPFSYEAMVLHWVWLVNVMACLSSEKVHIRGSEIDFLVHRDFEASLDYISASP